ncbi:hypothetical protein ACF1DY_31800 [Streptomyces albus]|uniref:hypothetical protein n=1 Tax=Streptomyces albus TaxID=1888 RepID=UPI0036F9E344
MLPQSTPEVLLTGQSQEAERRPAVEDIDLKGVRGPRADDRPSGTPRLQRGSTASQPIQPTP